MAFFYQFSGIYQNYVPVCNECGFRTCQIKYDGTYCSVCRDCYYKISGSSQPSFVEQKTNTVKYQTDFQQHTPSVISYHTQFNYNTDMGCTGGLCTRPQ